MRFNDDNGLTLGSTPSKTDAPLGRSLSRQKGGTLDVRKSRRRAVEWDQPCRRHRSSGPRAVEGRIAKEHGQNAGGRGGNGAHGCDLENADDLDPPDAAIAENSDLS